MAGPQPLWRNGPLFKAGAFGVSTDSVLLADFACYTRAESFMDLGCGSGLLCVLLGERLPNARIAGCELVPEWAEECRKNLAANGMDSRAEITTGDLRGYRELFRAGEYPLVVCNPPYFPLGAGKTARGGLCTARSEKDAALEDFCGCAAFLLKNGGRFCLVHRAESLSRAICAMTASCLEPKRLRLVQHSARHAPSLALLEGRKNAGHGLKVLPTLLLTEEGGGMSAEAAEIYHMTGENT